MKKLCIYIVFGFFLAPTVARAQEARLQGRLTDPTRVEVDAILDSVRTSGLPTEPLIDRALEGAAKRAPDNLIVAAVRRLWAELSIARDAFGESSTPTELTAGAAAIRAGASRESLAELRRLRPEQPITVAAAVLADLVAVGVPTDTAVVAVLALAPVTTDADYLAFRRNVEQDIALGASPSAALDVRLSLTDQALNSPGVLEVTAAGPNDTRTTTKRKP